MAVFNPQVSAQQAQAAASKLQETARQRRAPAMLDILEQTKNSRTFHIFNVGPWSQTVHTGSTGVFHIPAVPMEGDKGYAEKKAQTKTAHGYTYIEMTRTIPSLVEELIPKSEYEYERNLDDGERFANEVVGIGVNRNPAFALSRFGIFVSQNEVPTEQELYEATKALQAECSEIVADRRSQFSVDRKLFADTLVPEVHYKAARVLNLQNEVWMTDSTPSANVKCWACGSVNEAGTLKCGKCMEILDIEGYKAMRDRQKAIMGDEEEKRGPGRPRKDS